MLIPDDEGPVAELDREAQQGDAVAVCERALQLQIKGGDGVVLRENVNELGIGRIYIMQRMGRVVYWDCNASSKPVEHTLL